MQDIWQLSNDPKRYDWNDKLPIEFVERWNQIKMELPIGSEISVPRWVGITSNSIENSTSVDQRKPKEMENLCGISCAKNRKKDKEKRLVPY